MRLGAIPHAFGLATGFYKQELLFFDRLAVSEGDIFESRRIARKYFDDEVNERLDRAIDFLTDNDLLFQFDNQQLLRDFEDGTIIVGADDIEIMNKLGPWKEYLGACKRIGTASDREAAKLLDEMLHMWLLSHLLGIAERDHIVVPIYPGGVEAFHVMQGLNEELQGSQMPVQPSESKSKIILNVLDHFPVVDKEVSWEQIRDFKSDPASRSKFLALRNWITDKAYSNRSIAEIDEELEFLLDDYKHYMQQQKLKYEIGSFQLLVVSSLEILENLARLQFSKIAKTLFSFEERKAAFLGSWRDAPGREIAYISASQDRFESANPNVRGAE